MKMRAVGKFTAGDVAYMCGRLELPSDRILRALQEARLERLMDENRALRERAARALERANEERDHAATRRLLDELTVLFQRHDRLYSKRWPPEEQ